MNPSQTCNVLCHSHGEKDLAVCRFPAEEAGLHWNESAVLIKGHISAIDDRLEKEGRSDTPTCEDCKPWIVRCKTFVNTFGRDAVPRDIQRALNSVEEGLNLAVAVWPQN